MQTIKLAALLGSVFISASFAADPCEKLGQPCRAKQVLGTTLVTDRHDGRERLLLLNDNETYGCELLYVDFEKDTGEMYPAPAGAGSWTGIEVPGDRLVVGTFYDGTFMVFDLKTMRFIQSVKFPGESYIWQLVVGKDGRVYGGTYPGGKLGAIDLDTYTFADCGAPARPNQYLRNLSVTPWGQVVANFGMVANTTKLYDVAAKTWKDIPDLKAGQQFSVGVTWNNAFVATDPRSGRIQAFEDDSWVPSKTSVLASPDAAKYTIDTQLSNAQDLYLRQDDALFVLHADQATFAPTKLADVDLRGGWYVGVSRSGDLVGVRGQSYFVMKPGEHEPKFRPIPVESRGRPTLFLQADPHGRVWGGPHFGQTLFYVDTATGKAINTDKICDAGGEVYDVACIDGVIYAASYAGGDITAYDPAQPWDEWNHKNPRALAKVGPAYIRPEAGVAVGTDGRLYVGWLAKYGVYGGAVSITDPKTGKTDLIENPLGNQAIGSLAVDDKYIYVGTSLAGNGLPNQKGPAHFGVIEIASHKVVFDKAFDAAGVGRVAATGKHGGAVFTVGSKLYMYSRKDAAVTAEPIADLSGITARCILSLPDGSLLTACDKKICKLDLGAKRFTVMLETPTPAQSLTIGSDGRLYFNAQADLYRTREAMFSLK